MADGEACPNCGAEILRADDKFCRKCGYKLSKK
ncbi:MAG: zinc ribbon domain-containing protein [Bacteroidota bacterium]